MTVIIKTTPVTCRFRKCPYNQIAPLAGSQECIGCEGLKPKKPDKMTIAEHINTLQMMINDGILYQLPRQRNALKAGIEALKRLQDSRVQRLADFIDPLPGETKD